MMANKEREQRILSILTKLVSLKSITGTESENLASEYIYEYIKDLEYFKKYPENCGLLAIEGDPFKRHIPFALIEGKRKDTVILSGHFDVVDEFDYGDIKHLAYDLGDKLEAAIARNSMNTQQAEDMESEGWIWGKGAADMKGGIAIHMELLAEYADKALSGGVEGSILFMPVCDEESYSLGMRNGVKLLARLGKERHLEYKLLINSEPTDLVGGKQIMYLGSVGKLMPVVLVQGISSHIGHCFDGFNPLSILSGIYAKTSNSLDFVDKYEREATMPPTWLKMRDLKENYDVSVPLRAGGYFTVMSLSTSPGDTMEKIRKISEEVCSREIAIFEDTYREFKKINSFETKEKLGLEPAVYDFSSLKAQLLKDRGEAFTAMYEAAYREIQGEVERGKLTYPDGTLLLMEKVMNFANFTRPVVLLAFAPPYYPAVYGGENARKAYETVSAESKTFNIEVEYQNYFMGISDNSYSAFDSEQNAASAVAEETPLWGDIYSIDFDAIARVQVPAVIYGPIGREYHKWSERVEKNSLLNVVPQITRKLIEQAWDF